VGVSVRRLALVGILVAVALLASTSRVHASALPANFHESIVFSGLSHPTAVRFASDGRVFVAQRTA
jgi:hypothetical protein